MTGKLGEWRWGCLKIPLFLHGVTASTSAAAAAALLELVGAALTGKLVGVSTAE